MKACLRLMAVVGLLLMLASFSAGAWADSCTEHITDGGFETDTGWQLGPSPVMPQYVTYTKHSGNRSLSLGITSGANAVSFSSARQTVTIPPAAAQATLSFWFYAMADSPAATDYMKLALLDATGTAILAKPWYSHNDSRVWNQMSFDLTPWRGQTVQIYFNVYNDGAGGKAAMFLDDVSLTTCAGGSSPTPTGSVTATGTPVSTATVTPTPTPGCTDLLADGAFSGGLGSWQVADDPAGAAPANTLYRSAPYSLRLGSLDQVLNGLTTVRQLVTIPTGFPVVTLEVWVYTQTQPGAGADYQRVALQNSSGGLLYTPWATQENNPAWHQLSYNVSGFAGQTVFVSFAVSNDGLGGRTAMYVDDARLLTCSSSPTATATPTVAPAATVTPTPIVIPPTTPTAVPSGCIDLLQNGGFEAQFANWAIPPNPLSPQIVTFPVAKGTYAALLGSQTLNASSYSSIRQPVTAPATHPRVYLQFWTYTWTESPSGADRQHAVLLGPGDVVWAVPWSALESSGEWQPHNFHLIGVAGWTFTVYFNVYNDGAGGRTAMWVDEAHLYACTNDATPPPMSALAASAHLPQVTLVGTQAPATNASQEAGVTAAPAARAVQEASAAAAPAADTTRLAPAEPIPSFAGAQPVAATPVPLSALGPTLVQRVLGQIEESAGLDAAQAAKVLAIVGLAALAIWFVVWMIRKSQGQ